MTDDDLRAAHREASKREKSLAAPYAKARRGWRVRRLEAEAELARRGLS